MTGSLLPVSEDGTNAGGIGTHSSPQHGSPPGPGSRPGPGLGHAVEPPANHTRSSPIPDPDPVWDLGPPGFEATIDVFKCTIDEKTIYLGPWEIIESEPRRIVWQCSYQNERLEHFLPTPADGGDVTDPSILQSVFPFTFHGKHTQFSRPLEGEQAVTFQIPHRLRYTSNTGEVVFDQYMKPLYRFMTVASSLRFQGDLRQKALVDCFDADIVWTDTHRRENAFGGAMGIAAIQRVKLWRNARTGLHSLSVFASRWDRQHKEFDVRWFDGDIQADGKKRRVVLVIKRSPDYQQASPPFSVGSSGLLQWVFGGGISANRGEMDTNRLPREASGRLGSRRPSMSSNASSRASSYSSSFASSRTSISSYAASLVDTEDTVGPTEAPADIRYLAIEFTLNRDYQRFLKAWNRAHSADSDVPMPIPASVINSRDLHLDMPSPALLSSGRLAGGVATALPPLSTPNQDRDESAII